MERKFCDVGGAQSEDAVVLANMIACCIINLMITANVLERVVRVTCEQGFGTGFLVDHEDRQYLVTARHVVDDCENPEIRSRGNIVKVELERLTVPSPAADVAVFRLDELLIKDLPLTCESDGYVFGQDAYFLGFPFGMTFDIGPEYFPLIKRATISGRSHLAGTRPVLLLDGWNNPGFSGGPLVFRPPTSRGLDEPMRVCGIITAYRQEPSALRHEGQEISGAEVLVNSGIIIGEEIARVVETINAA